MLATFNVTLPTDVIIPPQQGGNCLGGLCTLRMAVLAANASQGADTINLTAFPTVTISLALGELRITESVTVNGPAGPLAASTTISGGSGESQSRIFNIGGSGSNTFNINNLTLTDGNGVGAFEGFGGAVLAFDGFENNDTINFNNVVVRDSNGSQQGGGIKVTAVTFNMSNSAIVGNRSTGQFGGGGIGVQDAQVSLTNVTLSDNRADVEGGAIGNLAFIGGQRSRIDIMNSTIVDNSSPVGSAIHTEVNSGALSAVTTYQNTIFADNAGSDNISANGTGASNVSDGGNISDDSSGNLNSANLDQSNTDPLVAPLSTHAIVGVSTSASIPSHPLLPGSPAIDAGRNAGAPGQDQRGVNRFDGDFNGSVVLDIGAYEFTPIVVTSPNDVVAEDGVCTLREAVAVAQADATNGTAGECGPNGDAILFHPSLGDPNNPVLVSNGQLTVSQPLTISGLGADQLHISARGFNRIFNFGGEGSQTYTVEKVTLRDGDAETGAGGAIFVSGDTLNLNQVVIRDNEADAGGGVEASDSSLNVTDSTISNNFANFGGGIRIVNSRGSIQNSTISGNTAATSGGGLANAGNGQFRSSILTLISSTIANNSSPNAANVEALTRNQSVQAFVFALSSIFAQPNGSGNFAVSGPGAIIQSTGEGRNVADDNSFPLGASQNGVDARLGPLGSNGGPTPTHALLTGSPAIDFGSDLTSGGITTDQRGVPRPQGDGVDAGAFEAQNVDVSATRFGGGNQSNVIEFVYEILSSGIAQLDLAFAVSRDANFDPDGCDNPNAPDADDCEIPGSRITITDSNLLSQGSHTLAIDAQSVKDALGQISTRFVLAVVDPADAIDEVSESNNHQYFTGVFFENSGTAVIRGRHHQGPPVGDPNDQITLTQFNGTAQVSFNGIPFNLPSANVDEYLILTEGGSDNVIADNSVTGRIRAKTGRDIDSLVGGAGNDLLIGGSQGDFVLGNNGNDRMQGGKGDDSMDGGTGDDVMNGGQDNDQLTGNAGNDRAIGSSGNDRLDGAAGNDSLNGNSGDDQLQGGDGDDRLLGGTGSDLLSGDGGNDVLAGMTHLVQADNAIDQILGGSGIDRILGIVDPLDVFDVEKDRRRS